MSLGIATLSTGQKRESGPPFVATAARNGLSVDASGQIVLGQDIGAVGNPAALLSSREIPLGAFDLNLNGQASFQIRNSAGTNYSRFLFAASELLRVGNIGISMGTAIGVAQTIAIQIGGGVNGRMAMSGYANAEYRTGNAQLTIAQTDTDNQAICIQKATANVNGPIFVFYKSRGTNPNTPVANVATDQLGRLIAQGVSADNVIRTAAEMRINAVQTNATSVATTFSIFTTSFAGVFANRYFFGADGDLGINTGAFLTPGSGIKFEVGGGHINMAGTTGVTYRWTNATTAPSLTAAAPAFTAFYGGNTNAMGDPVGWVLVNVAGTDRRFGFY